MEQLDPELNILVDGYKGGLKDLLPQYIAVTQIVRNYRSGSYCGDHEHALDVLFGLDKEEVQKLQLEYALVLARSDIDIDLAILKRPQ